MNFDEHINRIGTDSLKYDVIFDIVGRNDFKPLWVADMDFKTPSFIIKTIQKRLEQEILGYTFPSTQFYKSIIDWQSRRHGVELQKEHIHYVPGVVQGIHNAVCHFTEKGDKVLIQTPVYHPFHHVVEAEGRIKVESPLKYVGGRFEMDFNDLEKKLPECKMMILCNPHNPGGTIWHPEELARLAKLCKQHNVLVVSDEIHSDMTYAGYKHHPFVTCCEEARNITIALNSPSKAFNMPGIITSYYYIINEQLRIDFYKYIENADLTCGNVFAYDCLAACYSDEGEQWLNQMLEYVKGNADLVCEFLKANCPKIKAMNTEASFLVFLDNSEMPFANTAEQQDFYLNKANLFLNEGSMFGTNGSKFMRLNIALPRTELQEALYLLKKAYDEVIK